MVLVYDIMDRKSFENISGWISQIKEYADDGVQLMLLGNKCEAIPSEREVSEEEGQALANKIECPFMEVSAKENIRVASAFQLIAKEAKDKYV